MSFQMHIALHNRSLTTPSEIRVTVAFCSPAAKSKIQAVAVAAL